MHHGFLFALLFLLLPGAGFAQSFTKITNDPVVNDGRYSEGASWGDINGDGFVDLFVPDLFDQTNRLFLNDGDGSFTEVFSGPVVNDATTTPGGTFGDYDNDGDLDLLIVQFYAASAFLYQNQGNGTFTNITAAALSMDGGWSFGSSTADYDNDGFLDLYVTNIGDNEQGEGNFLYHNNGDGTFTRVTTGAVALDADASSSSSWADYDNDGDADLFVPNGGTFTPVEALHALYQNNNDGTFTRLDTEAIGIARSWGSFGNWADYDNDGDFDLFVTNYGGDNNILYINNGDGTFTRVTEGILVNDGGDSVSATWGDYDNDGDLDVYVTNDFNEDNDLYENLGGGQFAKITTGDLVSDGGRSNGATWVDYDHDGDLDLFVPNGQRPNTQHNILYRNDSNANHWINLLCTGTTSNRTAIGTKVRAKATINGVPTWQLRQIAGSTGFNAHNPFNVSFGLGDAAMIDSLVITWPSGLVEEYTNVAVDDFYEAIEGGGLQAVVTARENALPPTPAVTLHPNFPNPFRATTTIPYELAHPAQVTLSVYNLLGQRVASLVDAFQPAGRHTAVWNGQNETGRRVPNGSFFYRLNAGGASHIAQMVLVR